MRQVWSIFVKDVRHYWREIAASSALAAAFAWHEQRAWTRADEVAVAVGGGAFLGYAPWLSVAAFLLPIAWAFMVVRAVQGESLAGDRQFWVTRPYEWKKLLASKVLFVLAFVNVPMLVLDLYLLVKAGFPPTHYAVGLLWMQLLIMLFLLLPVAALATVTATVVQMLLAVLAVVIYMIGLFALAGQIPNSGFVSPTLLLNVLLLGTLLAVVVLQYGRRWTTRSRWLIAGLAAAFLLIQVITPYRALVAHEYPSLGPGQPVPFQLALLPPESTAARAPNIDEVYIQVPLAVTGIAPESIALLDGTLITIDAPDGSHWNSGWRRTVTFLFPEQKSTQITFTIKKDRFEHMRGSRVKLRMSLAFTLFHDQNQREFVPPQGEFELTGVGRCSADGRYGYSGWIHCLAPLRRPAFLAMSTDISASTCPVPEGQSRPDYSETLRGWSYSGDSGPAQLGISPVKDVGLAISNWDSFGKRQFAGICPGTPLVLSNPQRVYSARTEVDLDGVRLEDYQLKPLR